MHRGRTQRGPIALDHRPGRPRRRLALAVAALLAPVAVSGCSEDEPGTAASAPAPASESVESADEVPAEYEVALSEPVEDSVYPDFGDERIDTLHHDLDLTWDPDARRLTGVQEVTFRAAEDADEFVLDLAPGLEVTSATVDDDEVTTRHEDTVLTVEHEVEEGEVAVLGLEYAGRVQPTEAPMERTDMARLGLDVTSDGQLRTMQEPYGAHTWYAVNDQPADKAVYDVRVSVPAPWVGVSNGELVSRTEEQLGGRPMTVTEFELAEPAAAYLMTLAVGPYTMTAGGAAGENDTPLTYWTPSDRTDHFLARLDVAPEALAWVEERLGPYPFDTLGFVVVPGESAMETQTLITMGDDSYATSSETIVHEVAHHWWGDQVGPCDWRDLWMNEGMATYLQTLWVDEQAGVPEGTTIGQWRRSNNDDRADYGPPGDYRPGAFASNNVYVAPATMWHELREDLGDDLFWDLAARWPASQDNTCSDREELIAWWSEESGRDLSGFFEEWLMGRTDPR